MATKTISISHPGGPLVPVPHSQSSGQPLCHQPSWGGQGSRSRGPQSLGAEESRAPGREERDSFPSGCHWARGSSLATLRLPRLPEQPLSPLATSHHPHDQSSESSKQEEDREHTSSFLQQLLPQFPSPRGKKRALCNYWIETPIDANRNQ